MRSESGSVALRQKNRVRTAMYILDHNGVSRQELALALGFSMPTVFQNVNELIESGLVCENGEYGSTGGRKAKILSIRQGVRCAIGVEITAHHVRLLLMDLSRKLMDIEQQRFVYEDTTAYYIRLGEIVQEFARKNGVGADTPCRMIGVGIALPGIIDHKRKLLAKSHALDVENISLWQFSQNIPYPVVFGNDANLAAYAEVRDKQRNTIYLSLNDTVGGAIYQNGDIYLGDNFKSGEIGHMILVPGGKKCYCGKRGCLDAYCSAKVLRRDENDRGISRFFEDLENGDPECIKRWDVYLEHLAVMVSNLRMAFDCDIILGGHVGGYMGGHMRPFSDKIRKYNNFDSDTAYLSQGQFKRECASIGAARSMVDYHIENLPVELDGGSSQQNPQMHAK